MRIFRSPIFYFAVFICFCVVMAIRQELNDREYYHTVVNITYQDNTKDVLKQEGRPDVKLDEGERSVGGIVVKSYVKTFDWNVYKNK